MKVKLFSIFSLATLVALSFAASSYARQLTTSERKKYGQNNILFYVPCDTEADCTKDNTSSGDGSDSNNSNSNGNNNQGGSQSSGTTNVSGPEGINISKEVFKPCPSNLVQQTTRSGNTYDYTYSGKTYKVANTKLDLNSYMNYLQNRHIAQDGRICDPDTGRCYNGSGYNDYDYCLSIAGAMAGNLQKGNCTATDYGFMQGKGSIQQEPHESDSDEVNGRRRILQKIYDAIMAGKPVLVKVRSVNSRHFATAVGVRANANRATLVDSDILYLDTNSKLTTARELFFELARGGGYWIHYD